MARKKQTSPVEGVVHVVALLPWWIGVALALVSYVLLHRIAAQPIVISLRLDQIGSSMFIGVGRAMAIAGQYLLPFLCLVGAAISAWKRRQRRALVHDVAQGVASDVLDGMSWREFEVLVGEGFRLQGYQVAETGGGGADGGVDLVLRRGGEKFLVQCKQWRAFKVSVEVVRELYGVMAARGAAGGFVVTSGRFTAAATEFANGRNIRLVDGPQLVKLIQQAQAAAKGGTSSPSIVPVAPVIAAVAPPPCPLCASQMVRRTAKRGARSGAEFWGCTGYPACRGTRVSP